MKIGKFLVIFFILLTLPQLSFGMSKNSYYNQLSPWIAVGAPVLEPIPVPNLTACNYRLAVSFNDSYSGNPVTTHFYPDLDFTNVGDVTYITLIFNLTYAGVATLNDIGLFENGFFQEYLDRLTDPQERPLESQIHLGVGPINGQTSLYFWYRYLDSEGNFHGPTQSLNNYGTPNPMILEKQCP